MYDNNPAYQEYPEVTPDASTIEEPNDHKKAVATAVGGSIVLGAAAYGLSLLDDTSGNEAPVSDDASSVAAAAAADARAKASLPIVQVSAPADSGLDKLNWPLDRLDELTFDEAFAAARHQMGPAHHFNWHSGMFNTFYQQEEADLTKSERDSFIASLPGGDKQSASVNDVEPPTRMAQPSGGGHHHAPAAAAPEPQLAAADAADAPLVASNAAPVLTVIPLAAVAELEVTPMLDAHTLAATPMGDQLVADHGGDPMHHGSLTGSPIETVDGHSEIEHDSSHDADTDTDHHHFGH